MGGTCSARKGVMPADASNVRRGSAAAVALGIDVKPRLSNLASSAAELEFLRQFRCSQQELDAARRCFMKYAVIVDDGSGSDDCGNADDDAAAFADAVCFSGQRQWTCASTTRALADLIADPEVSTIDPDGSELSGALDGLNSAISDFWSGSKTSSQTSISEASSWYLGVDIGIGSGASTAPAAGSRSHSGSRAGSVSRTGSQQGWGMPFQLRLTATKDRARELARRRAQGGDFAAFCAWWFLPDAQPGVNFGKWWWRDRWNQRVARLTVHKSRTQQLHETLAQHVSTKKVKAGEDVMVEGDLAEDMFFIQSGELQVFVRERHSSCGNGSAGGGGGLQNDSQAGQRLVNTLSASACGSALFFGERALLAADGLRTATVRAVTDCVLLRLSREAFQQVLVQQPSFVDNIASRHYTTDEGKQGSEVTEQHARKLMRAMVRVQQDYMQSQRKQRASGTASVLLEPGMDVVDGNNRKVAEVQMPTSAT